jgi:hypothetical protein
MEKPATGLVTGRYSVAPAAEPGWVASRQQWCWTARGGGCTRVYTRVRTKHPLTSACTRVRVYTPPRCSLFRRRGTCVSPVGLCSCSLSPCKKQKKYIDILHNPLSRENEGTGHLPPFPAAHSVRSRRRGVYTRTRVHLQVRARFRRTRAYTVYTVRQVRTNHLSCHRHA